MRTLLLKKAAFLSLALLACLSVSAQGRNPHWATSVPAIYFENLYRIDEGVYRCEQPSAEGFAELYRMGVREVLNLRNWHNDQTEVPLMLHRVPMRAGRSDTEQFVAALRIIRDRRGPIAIHCWHGSDRTGIVSALYRIVFQGWSRDQAIEELEKGGYGYHAIYGNIKTYLEQADVEWFKRTLARE